jgi:hypothetical protein
MVGDYCNYIIITITIIDIVNLLSLTKHISLTLYKYTI